MSLPEHHREEWTEDLNGHVLILVESAVDKTTRTIHGIVDSVSRLMGRTPKAILSQFSDLASGFHSTGNKRPRIQLINREWRSPIPWGVLDNYVLKRATRPDVLHVGIVTGAYRLSYLSKVLGRPKNQVEEEIQNILCGKGMLFPPVVSQATKQLYSYLDFDDPEVERAVNIHFQLVKKNLVPRLFGKVIFKEVTTVFRIYKG